MPLEAPETGFVWLHVPRREPVDVVVVSDVHTWFAHFVRVPGLKGCRAARCLKQDGAECSFCAAEIGRRARYVFAVRAGDATRLVELGRVQYPTLSMIYEGGRWVGSRLRLAREWDAVNARIAVAFLGREVISDEVAVEIGDYVASLGRSEAASMRPPVVGVSSPSSKASLPSSQAAQNGAGGWKNAPR